MFPDCRSNVVLLFIRISVVFATDKRVVNSTTAINITVAVNKIHELLPGLLFEK
jgi:hypothetical protein